MTKLHQVVAVLNGKKTKTLGEITELHQKAQKPALFAGQSRTYRPLNESGEKLPDETQIPPEDARDIQARARQLWSDYFDVVLTVDTGSTKARSDVSVDGQTILKDVPVLSLIFMEQQLNDIRKFVATMPVLDPNHRWDRDESKGMYVTAPVELNRTIKQPKAITLAVATDKHPAQVQLVNDDVWVGVYTTTKFSTAIKAQEKRQYLDRVDKLIEAVKTAREEANTVEVEQRKEADNIFKFILGG